MPTMTTLPRPVAPVRPPSAAEHLVQRGRAAEDALGTYLAGLQAAFGPGWRSWWARSNSANWSR